LRNRAIYLMLLPVLAYYLIFHYGPMYGAVIAFQDFNPLRGILGSKWVGLENFTDFFNSVFFLPPAAQHIPHQPDRSDLRLPGPHHPGVVVE